MSGSLQRCDLILLTWNRLDLLRPCVERIFAHTNLPSRLILVDNGTTDRETLDYLRGLKGTPTIDLEIVRIPENVWISKAINEGLSRAKAPWLCLLNNDILVTEGWLSEMIHVAQSHPNIGLLNPMSGEFGVLPHPRENVDEVGRRLRRFYGQWLENSACVGFCMLLPKRVLDQVGYFDDQFQFFYFEDADYCLRVRQAGFDCGVARGTYVYHHGGATLKGDPTRDQRFRQNEERFFKKWGRQKSLRIAWIVPDEGRSPHEVRAVIRRQANEGHKIWVFHTSGMAECIPAHLQVVPIQLPRFLFGLSILIRVLSKKKKFNRISLLTKQGFGHWIGRLHGAEVVCES